MNVQTTLDPMATKVATLDRAGGAAPSGAPVIPYEDLREWIEQARALDEVRHAKGLSWERDIGMASEIVIQDDNGPAVLFEEIPGSLPGSRLLVNIFGGTRRNMTLGFPAGLSRLDLSEAFRLHYMSDLVRIPPRYVETGPIFENRMVGDDIDITRFPTPMWHQDDGGRYIGTGSFNVTRDPDDGWINCGTYRVMIHDRRTVGFYISPGKHGRIHRDKYEARQQPMPVVVVAGGDPLTFLMTCTEVPNGVCEYDIVGGIRGKPVEVVHGPVTGLPIPARAEIALEGFVQPGNLALEGPFGEWMGYYGTEITAEPVLDIQAVYYRNNPIMLGCPPLRAPDEIARLKSIIRSALLRESISKAGVPDVTSAWAHEIGTSRLLLGVAIKQRYAGHARQAGHIACQCHVGAYAGRYVVVVDDDIDVSNLDELIWALLTRSDPATSIDIVPNAWSTPLDVRIDPEKRKRKEFTNSRAVIDACRPWHWRDQFPKASKLSAEERKEAYQRFGFLLR
jgi:UbiD family decarboxylase